MRWEPSPLQPAAQQSKVVLAAAVAEAERVGLDILQRWQPHPAVLPFPQLAVAAARQQGVHGRCAAAPCAWVQLGACRLGKP